MLDSYSRYIANWDLREDMKENDVAIVQQATLEKIPSVFPRYISGDGEQFTGTEFQYFIALHGLTHVRTSPYYRQSNWKAGTLSWYDQERMHSEKSFTRSGSC